MPTTTGTRTFNVTLITVCVAPESIAQALQVAEGRRWAVTEASFEEYISAKRRTHFADHLRAGDACVAMLNFDKNPVEAAQTSAYLHQVFAGKVLVMALSSHPSKQRMLAAMQAGCMEFLCASSIEELDEAFRRVEQNLATRSITTNVAGSILAFFGAKGGVGTTTLALHLAIFLVSNNRRKVLLIDNHPHFGHICIHLGVDGAGFHFQELVRNVNRLDSELLQGFVLRHSSGLDVLSSPDLARDARPMHPADLAATLEFLRSEYDYVIVDSTTPLTEVNCTVLAAASEVYVIATPEISAIRDLSRCVDDLALSADMTNKVKVIINRYSSQFAVALEHIEKAIHLPVSFSIPNTYLQLVRSANLGVPLGPDDSSGFAKEMTTWANMLAGLPHPLPSAQTAPAPGLLGFLREQLTALVSSEPPLSSRRTQP